jgi:hypothetical protein
MCSASAASIHREQIRVKGRKNEKKEGRKEGRKEGGRNRDTQDYRCTQEQAASPRPGWWRSAVMDSRGGESCMGRRQGSSCSIQEAGNKKKKSPSNCSKMRGRQKHKIPAASRRHRRNQGNRTRNAARVPSVHSSLP